MPTLWKTCRATFLIMVSCGVCLLKHPTPSRAQSQISPADTVRKAAERGDPIAQFNLGSAYFDGRDVEPNEEQGLLWLRKAGEQGHVGAQFRLGMLFYERRSFRIPRDIAKAKYWMAKAADQGHTQGQYMYAVILKENRGTFSATMGDVAFWYRKAAEKGHKWAQQELGTLLFYGSYFWDKDNSLPKNLSEAAMWYRLADIEGNPAAADELKKPELAKYLPGPKDATISCASPVKSLWIEYPGQNPPVTVEANYFNYNHSNPVLIWDMTNSGHPPTTLVAHCSTGSQSGTTVERLEITPNFKWCLFKNNASSTDGKFQCSESAPPIPKMDKLPG